MCGAKGSYHLTARALPDAAILSMHVICLYLSVGESARVEEAQVCVHLTTAAAAAAATADR